MATWSNEKTLTFINAVRRRRELWDKEFDGYKHRVKKCNSWMALGAHFKMTGDEAYKKFKNLRTYTNYEHKKILQKGGKKTDIWFAYDAMKFAIPQNDLYARSLILPNFSENCLDSDNNTTHETTILERAESTETDEDTPLHLDELQHSPSTSYSQKNLLQTTKQSLETKTYEKTHNSKLKRPYPTSGFLEHIANKMNGYDQYTRSNVELKISKILYEADMSMLRSHRSTSEFCEDRSGASSPISAKDVGLEILVSEIKKDPSSPN